MRHVLSALALVAAMAAARPAPAIVCSYDPDYEGWRCSMYVSVTYLSNLCYMEINSYGAPDWQDCVQIGQGWCEANDACLGSPQAAATDYGTGSLSFFLSCDCYNYAGGYSEVRIWMQHDVMANCSCVGDCGNNWSWRFKPYCI